MHDFNLGGPVDVGEYTGPMVEGKPLHSGNCEDGVYGCRKCNAGARKLTTAQLEALGWDTHSTCDWCKKETPIQEMRGCAPADEGGRVYYEVCKACKDKHDAAVEREYEEEMNHYGYDYYDD